MDEAALQALLEQTDAELAELEVEARKDRDHTATAICILARMGIAIGDKLCLGDTLVVTYDLERRDLFAPPQEDPPDGRPRPRWHPVLSRAETRARQSARAGARLEGRARG